MVENERPPEASDVTPDAWPRDGELTDDDLEFVVGGLARAWVGDAPPPPFPAE